MLRTLVQEIRQVLAEGSTLLRSNGHYEIADALLKLGDAIELLVDTTDEDNGNVLTGFSDENAKARAEINEAVAVIAGYPMAIGVEAAVGVALVTTGVTGAIAVGAIGSLALYLTSEAATWLVETLSAEGITLVGQLVDYSEATTGLTIIGTTAADRITATAHDDTVQMGLSDDVLYEMGGSDQVDGGFGTDELSYLRSESAVVFDFGNGEAKQGGDTDIFENIEIFSGSDFDDSFSFVGIETMSPFDPSIPYATHQNLLR